MRQRGALHAAAAAAADDEWEKDRCLNQATRAKVRRIQHPHLLRRQEMACRLRSCCLATGASKKKKEVVDGGCCAAAAAAGAPFHQPRRNVPWNGYAGGLRLVMRTEGKEEEMLNVVDVVGRKYDAIAELR